ncbi:MAG TPA: hypothetical protein VFK44_14730, partial [Bacillales bacterium]|nr:hypothetical protein [Bacillales bacterium]
TEVYSLTRKEQSDKPANSSMAKDAKEVDRLGKEMETMDTNKQVRQKGETPDPKQQINSSSRET